MYNKVVADRIIRFSSSHKMDETNLESWLTTVLSRLVTKPKEIEVVKTIDEQGVLFTVKVADEDVGKVIGKKGVIAQALRTLLRSAGYMEDMRASMKVEAPNSKFSLADEDR